MGKLKAHAQKRDAIVRKFKEEQVTNFMDGISYKVNPLDTLKIIASSSIFGEPSYYRKSKASRSRSYVHMQIDKVPFLFAHYKDPKMSTEDVFEDAIDNALEFDFFGTLKLAVELRSAYQMRLNPSVIVMRAAVHPKRVEFSKEAPGLLRDTIRKVIQRPDDSFNQFEYYMYMNGSKKGLPSVVKRAWGDKLTNSPAWALKKYIQPRLFDIVNIAHPKKSEALAELMTTGDIKVDESDTKWETLRAQGKSFKEIYEAGRFNHMALLRNLRNIFTETEDLNFAKIVVEDLKNGVEKGRQFPFRYYTAHNILHGNRDINHLPILLDGLEDCIDLAMDNFPKLDGKTMCLADNSGSAHGALPSQYGTVNVAQIANLSSIMTAANSDEGYVGVFGDTLKISAIKKRAGILEQHKKINGLRGTIGGGTEHGIWLFWEQALAEKQHWDNVFIYSDMQAGHGNLYGHGRIANKFLVAGDSRHIDVLKCVQAYREEVNPKVNVFSVQVAGYDNSVLPENLYRTALLSGWTGNETIYANSLNNVWDQLEQRQ